MILVGLDPGTHTGWATWNAEAMRFEALQCLAVHQALKIMEGMHQAHPGNLLVIFEDARKRQRFSRMDIQQQKYGAAIREGAGAAKRDASIWDDFLTELGIPFIASTPRGTKRSAEHFRLLTKWEGRTNEHMRDAGLIVYGIEERRAQLLMTNAIKPKGKTCSDAA